MATVDSIVDQLQSTANSALTSAREQASRIGYTLLNISNAQLDYSLANPNLQAPPQFSDLFPGADTSNQLVQWANAQTDALVEQYFPELATCLRTLPEEWVCGILSGDKEFGLDRTVFEIVWQRGRDRQYRDSASSQATLRADWSQRGFSLPTGAMVQLGVEAEARAGAAVAEINREQFIQEAQIKLDLMKFAEEQAVKLKLGLLDAMRQYLVTITTLPDKDIERARIRAQAYSSFYSALSSYYDVELGFEKLRFEAANARAELLHDTDKIKVSLNQSDRNTALGQATRGFTDVAAAASNAGSALVADVTTGGGTTA